MTRWEIGRDMQIKRMNKRPTKRRGSAFKKGWENKLIGC